MTKFIAVWRQVELDVLGALGNAHVSRNLALNSGVAAVNSAVDYRHLNPAAGTATPGPFPGHVVQWANALDCLQALRRERGGVRRADLHQCVALSPVCRCRAPR